MKGGISAEGHWSSRSQALDEAIRRFESRFIRAIDEADDGFFDSITKNSVMLTESEYGVLFEVLDYEGGALLRAIATFPKENIESFYQDTSMLSDVFYNAPSFFNQVMMDGRVLIANDPENDPRSGEYAPGHPAVKSFLGEPFYFGGKMLGVLALMNRPTGYDERVAEFLAPLSSACGYVLFAMRNNKRRMQAEIMLKDSVSSIGAIVDTVADGIMTINENGMVETFNPAAERIFGYVKNEVIGRNVSLLMPDDYCSGHDGYLMNYLTTGERKVIGIGREVEGQRRDGATFPLELSVSEMAAGGGLRMFTGIVRDITKRKQSEEALRDNMARIAAIVDTVVDGIVMIDDGGMIESFNPAAERIFGYSNEDVVGRNVSMLMPEPYHEGHDGYLTHYKDTGEKRVIGMGREVEGRRKDGSTFPLELSVSEMWLGQLRKFTGIVRDVTERKKSEDEVRDSAARIEAIVETVVDGIITINERGVIETINPAAELIFGHFADKVVGRNVSMLMPEPYHEEHDSYLENYLRTGTRKVIGIGREVLGLHKDGDTFPLELSVSEMWLGGQRMFTGVVRDITERKNIETMKNEFISTVSHELRTPLTSIRGSLGLIVGGAMGGIPDKALQMIEIADKNAQRLISLINDILDIEKIAAGKMEFNLQVQPLLPIILLALESNAAYGEQYGVRYRMEDFQRDVYVNVDADRLLQVLSNFMSNAAKFSPQGGEVEIHLESDGDHIRIMVVDHGEGIPEAFQGKIFQKFSQADSGNARKKQGTGLGLAITKEIVEQMGGSVGFISEKGKGSRFYCRLPESRMQDCIVAERKPLWISERASDEQHEHSGVYNILHIEGDEDLLDVVAEVCLNVAGFDRATTLKMARAQLGSQHYDLVLLDLELQDGSGWELLPVINELEHSPPVLVLTAHNVSHEQQQQVAGVLLKSRTSNEQLLTAIRDVLGVEA
ncbi:MAG: hypothetical protein COB71_06150 [Thiotrichales bacterium]|nr:MAG: hypothetical protein COB71_12260 [Thiotrichales bacterium]PCI13352.1 MAG: hypothetical protein COB71_06150 [Thiotrichales bacterium]